MWTPSLTRISLGKNWKDMDFFKKMTTETADPNKQNCVIMGRKTWFSIPEKFRPLRNRVNIVLSRELREVPEEVHIARSLPEAIELVTQDKLDVDIENIHVIGGSSVYKEAMAGPYNCRIFLTRILADFDCDTFLPEIDEKLFNKIDSYPGVSTDLQTENDIKFRFEVYEKTRARNTRMEPGIIGEPFQFDLMAAMCDGNRGIGYQGGLPWTGLREDYHYYTQKISAVSTPGKKSVHIRGRLTWESARDPERSNPNVIHIIISKTVKAIVHPNVYAVVPSFGAAVDLVNSAPLRDKVDCVWVMGGTKVYEASMKHPLCRYIYLTKVYKDFPADAVFPEFEEDFEEISKPDVRPDMMEENGIRFQFKVYKKKN